MGAVINVGVGIQRNGIVKTFKEAADVQEYIEI